MHCESRLKLTGANLPDANQAYPTAAPEPSEAKPLLSPNPRSLDDSPVRRYSSRQKNRLFNFSTRIGCSHRVGPAGMGDVRDRAIDYRAVIATAAIEVMIELW
jgi:hypothetical protein